MLSDVNTPIGSLVLMQLKNIDVDTCLKTNLENPTQKQAESSHLLPIKTRNQHRDGQSSVEKHPNRHSGRSLTVNGDVASLNFQVSRLSLKKLPQEQSTYLPNAMNNNFPNLRFASSQECDFRPTPLIEGSMKCIGLKTTVAISNKSMKTNSSCVGTFGQNLPSSSKVKIGVTDDDDVSSNFETSKHIYTKSYVLILGHKYFRIVH